MAKLYIDPGITLCFIAGIFYFLGSSSTEFVKKYKQQGFNLLAVDMDVLMLGRSAKTTRDEMQQ